MFKTKTSYIKQKHLLTR